MDSPPGWSNAPLSEICAINPRVDKNSIDADSLVSFVPMPAVEAETGKIDVSQTRAFRSVRQGYTPFRKGDVLFAKITPCMENGKMGVVPHLVSEYGFGSTEFHVLRPAEGIDPRFLYHAVSNRAFRHHAEHNMTGAVGQKRVPASILEDHEIWLPPTAEQRRIVERLEALFAEIDRGVESLRAAKSTLDLYRQSLLKSAFEGRLTADWRAQNPDKLESPDALLARIRREREARHQAALDDWQRAVAEWKDSGENGRKPGKPNPSAGFDLHPTPEDSPWPTVHVRALLDEPLINGRSAKERDGGFPVLRLTALRSGKIDLRESKEGDWTRNDAEPFIVRRGDVFVSRGNGSRKLVGVGGRVLDEPMPVAFPDTMIRVRLDTTAVRPAYFVLAWNSWTVRQQIESAARTTAGIYKINQRQIGGFSLPLPSLAEQAQIVRILDARLETAESLEAEIDANLARADALRQSILKQAFSGKLVAQDPDDEPAAVLLKRIKANGAPRRRKPATRKRKVARA